VPEAPTEQQDRRRRLLRTIVGRGGAYLILVGFAAVMLFPFVYMATGAVKTPSDTFRYPPKVLPRVPLVADVDGEEREVFSLDFGSGEERAVLVETGVDAGLFVDPADPERAVPWPLDLARETGSSVTIDGESLSTYDIELVTGTETLALQRNTSVGRFQQLDGNGVTYAVPRTATPAETIEAQWENFEEVIGLRDLDRALTNTILVTILVVAGTLFTSIMGGYAFARVRFPGRDKMFLAYLGSIMLPFVVLIIPLFQLMVGLGWVNHIGSLVWPFLFNAYGTFLMRQFFIAIPKDLEEAAFIDGAKRGRILWTIFVPLSWPAIATLATFMFLYAWNSFIWPLVSINVANADNFVLTLALQQLGGTAGESPNLLFAGIVLSVLVPFTVFAFAQRYFVENVATSGIK
jgi:multiple sugar transport system permease protein